MILQFLTKVHRVRSYKGQALLLIARPSMSIMTQQSQGVLSPALRKRILSSIIYLRFDMSLSRHITQTEPR